MGSEKEQVYAINSLKGIQFDVKEYQRGYKWGVQQVQELLTDIHDFDRGGLESFYCLQPVVVKTIGDNQYELIDGQQRLTTIFIILQCLNENVYGISYRTRKNSEKFLNEINNLDVVNELDVCADIEKVINPLLYTAWNDYVKNHRDALNNIDNFHFYCAYQFIRNWIKSISEELQYFKENLLHYTKVIWYEQSGTNTAEEVFMKFNQGKIELAQAELIKALFVLQINDEKNVELRSYRLNQFAEEWNNIENQLQNDSFWFFISNNISDDKKSNRIDLLFDLIAKKPNKSNNKLYSYHNYLEQYSIRKKDKTMASLDWSAVNDLFNQLYEWYNDRELYHLVGFIVYKGISTVAEINDLYNKVADKRKFKIDLKGLVNDYLFGKKNKNRFNLESIVYGSNNKDIETVLVLHNVINYLFTDNHYRFPYDRLKLEQGWSLEHIHAQNTDKFEELGDIKKWIDDINRLASNFKQDEKLNDSNVLELTDRIEAIEDKLSQENISKDDNELKGLVKILDEKVTSYFNKDDLNNLCLLDRKTNSSIGNKFFAEKREEVLKIDKMSLNEYNDKYKKNEKLKPFIPLATKHVFLKYFTNEGDVQMTFWGAQDRRDYQNHILNGIKIFLHQ